MATPKKLPQLKVCKICNLEFYHPKNHHAANTCSIHCRKKLIHDRRLIYYTKNKDKEYIRSRQWKKDNKSRHKQLERKSHIKRSYGLSTEKYDEMLKLQNYTCAICKNINNKSVKLAVDHCHITGKVRGLLCFACNSSIGKMKESVAILKNAIEYLQSYSGVKNV